MSPLIVTGVLLAIGYALVPGPINAETARRGVRDGFRPALGVQMGALAGDVPWMVLSLTGVALVLQGALLSTVLGLVGAGFLVLLARSAFRSALGRGPVGTTVPDGRGWRVGLVMSVANPGAIAFWTGVGSGVLATSRQEGPEAVWILVVSYSVASALVGVLVAGMSACGRRWAQGGLMRWIDGFCGIALMWCAASLAWSVVGA
jgi:chemosensory pili system protein ChpE/L-lysine exporter family protein LysE/ArgO